MMIIYGFGGFDPAIPAGNVAETLPPSDPPPPDPVVALVETLVAKEVLDPAEAAAILAADS